MSEKSLVSNFRRIIRLMPNTTGGVGEAIELLVYRQTVDDLRFGSSTERDGGTQRMLRPEKNRLPRQAPLLSACCVMRIRLLLLDSTMIILQESTAFPRCAFRRLRSG